MEKLNDTTARDEAGNIYTRSSMESAIAPTTVDGDRITGPVWIDQQGQHFTVTETPTTIEIVSARRTISTVMPETPKHEFIDLGKWYGVNWYVAMEDGAEWAECPCGGTLDLDARRGGLRCLQFGCHVEVAWDPEDMEQIKTRFAEKVAKRDARKAKTKAS